MEGKLRYSQQAKVILKSLKNESIDIDKFEKWVQENKFIVGGGYIVEYLQIQSKKKNDVG